mgnify:CR=1 FL=1
MDENNNQENINKENINNEGIHQTVVKPESTKFGSNGDNSLSAGGGPHAVHLPLLPEILYPRPHGGRREGLIQNWQLHAGYSV